MKKFTLALASLCAAFSAQAQIYDAAADFDISDPNGGNFNYGYVVNGQTSFNPYTEITVNFIDSGSPSNLNEFGTVPGGDTVPGVFQNPNSTTTLLNSSQFYMPANSLMIYSDGGSLATLRFITPTSGTYNINISLDRSTYVGSQTSGYLIFKNLSLPSIEALDINQSYFDSGNLDGSYNYVATLDLLAGDTIDLLTVAGGGPVGVNLTATAVPEPSTWAFLILSASAIGVITWRRRCLA